MVKKLIKIAAVLVVILVIVVAVVLYNINSIAKSTIETGGTQALGVPTKVDSVSISLLSGTAAVNKLNIANPPGFKTPHLLDIGKFNVEVDTGTLTSETVVIPLIELDGASFNLEQSASKTNIKVISDNIAKMSGPAKEEETPAEEGTGKKFKVDKLVIKNVNAHLEFVNVPLMKELSSLDVKIDEIIVDDLTDDNAKGVAMDELTKRIIPIIITAVLDKAKAAGLNPEILKGLTQDLGSLVGNLGAGATKMVTEMGGEIAKQVSEQATKIVGDVTKEIGKVGEGLGKEAGKVLEDATKGIGDLLGGNKDKDKKSEDSTDKKIDDNPLGGLGNLLGGDKDKK